MVQYRFFRQIQSKRKAGNKMKKTFKAFSLILSSILLTVSTPVCLYASAPQNAEALIKDGYVPIEDEDDFVKHWKDKEAADINKNVVFALLCRRRNDRTA